jgi:hypothetical protein
MASVGGDVAEDDRDDFGVGAQGLHTTKCALLREASHELCSPGERDTFCDTLVLRRSRTYKDLDSHRGGVSI